MVSSLLTAGLVLLRCLAETQASPIASSASYTYAVKDRHHPPSGWSIVEPAPPQHLLDVSVGLTQNRFNELQSVLYQVSDPSHGNYGKYLSDGEIYELIKPTDDALSGVRTWLEAFGFDTRNLHFSPAKDWIRFTAPVATLERLLNTTYYVYEYEDGSTLVRTDEWSLPLHLHEHITTIQPTNSFARLRGRTPFGPARSVSVIAADPAVVSAACNFSNVTPLCLRTLYGTLSYAPKVPGKNRMGLTDYLEEYNKRSDTSIFLQTYRPEAAAAAYEFTQISIAGGPIDNGTNTADTEPNTGFEGNLDAQTMLGIAWPTPLTAWSTGGRDPSFMPDLFTTSNSDEPFLTWATYLASQPATSIPQVISTSYGDDEQTVSKSYATAVCNQFAQLGAKGISILFASGDYGVGPDGYCYSNADNTTAKFLPSFPNDCPFVTDVGATTKFPETAAYDTFSDGCVFTSGAGFSEYFAQPAYQSQAVDAYVARLNGKYAGLYNPAGRAYPDISCNGQGYAVIWNGSLVHLDGTSASTPACSAIFTLVNDALIAAGRPTLGFLNPWLYGGGYKNFVDITNGTSQGCNTTGFPAAVGWDAVTGFGTPYFPKILQSLGL